MAVYPKKTKKMETLFSSTTLSRPDISCTEFHRKFKHLYNVLHENTIIKSLTVSLQIVHPDKSRQLILNPQDGTLM